MQADPIWLFDGVCVLCSRGVQYTLRHERAPAIRFIAIQSDAGQRLAAAHGIDPEDPATFLFIEKGRALEKSDAVIALSRYLKGPAQALAVLRVLPKPLRDWLYDVLARNRYRIFGKSQHCLLPPPGQQDRFVL